MSDRLGRADLQIHTDASDGMDDPLTILNAAHEQQLDLIAITDHDQTRGALIAQETAARLGHPVEVIVGSEVSSRQGHILALWIEQPIPAFRSAAATVTDIWRQGGSAVIAHPGAIVPLALNIRSINQLLRELAPELGGNNSVRAPDAPILALETANPIPTARWFRERFIAANQRWRLAETGGSDAHFHEQVGAGRTRFPGRDASSLRDALQTRNTTAEIGDYPSLRTLGASRLLRQQWRGISATPKVIIGRRLGVRR